MQYDRRVPPALLDLLLPRAPLGWLIPWLSTPRAAVAGAHVQTRRDRRLRPHGGLLLCFGRTIPLELRPRPNGRFRLFADRAFRAITPNLFDREWTTSALASDRLCEHVQRSAREGMRQDLDGQAALQASLLRHYGPLAQQGAPFLALDSDVEAGFASPEDQSRFEATLRAAAPLGEATRSNLAMVATDENGRLLLVAVEPDASRLPDTASSVAAHTARFQALLSDDPNWFTDVLVACASERHRVGLLGHAGLPRFDRTPSVTPVIAAPESRAGWCEAWRLAISPVVLASPFLAGLRFWRLSPEGRVVEDLAA